MQDTSGCSQSSNPSGSRPPAGEHRGMGSDFIAGVFLPARKEKLSVSEAMRRGLLSPGTALVLLEAQAASGLLTEPTRNERLSVQEALAQGLIGHDFLEKLLSAEGAVKGYTEPYTGQKMSLFQAMGQGLILRAHGIRLLQAQLATGGIIDPERGHRVPVEVAYERGYLDQEMSQILCDPENQTRSCFDPNTHENLTYLQLLRRCVPDPDTGLLMLQLMDKGSALHQLSQEARTALQAARTTLPLGLFQGHSVSLWELLFSRHVPEQRRQELLRQYKAGTVTIAEMMELLTAMVTRAEAQGHGANVGPEAAEREALPDPVQNGSASNSQKEQEPKQEREQEQEQGLERSLKSHTVEVSAGGSQKEREQERDQEWKWEQERDPKRDQEWKWEQERDPKRDQEWKWEQEQEREQDQDQEQMLELERSLKSHTLEVSAGGCQGRKVSLWELLFSKFVPEPQREELLREHRAGTVTIAEMIELLTTVVTGAESEKGALGSPTAKMSDEVTAPPPGQEQRLRKSLKSVRVRVTAGELRGRNVSVLDLLFSGYVPQGTRQELLGLHRAGILSTEQVATVVTNMVTRAEAANSARSPHRAGEDEEGGPARLDDALKATPVDVGAGELQGRQVSLWELLFSQDIPEEKRQELLQLYREGFLTLELMTTVVSMLIRKKESTGRKFHITVKGSNQNPGTAAEGGDNPQKEEPWETTLKTTAVDVEAAEFRGRRVSLWELLHCRHIPGESREELLQLYRAGELSLEQVRAAVSTAVSRAAAAAAARAGPEEPGSGPGAEPVAPGSGPRAEPVAPGSGFGAEPVAPVSGPRAEPVAPGSGPGAEPVAPGSGLGAEPMAPVSGSRAEPVAPVSGPGAEPVAPGSGPGPELVATEAEPSPLHGDRAWEETPKASTAQVSPGDAQGRQGSLGELLSCRHIPEERRQELLERHRAGTPPLQGLSRGGTLPLQELPSTTSSRASDSAGSPLRAPPPLTVDLLRSEGSHITLGPCPGPCPGPCQGPCPGPCQARSVSVWELLSSRRVSEFRREARLETFPRAGLRVKRITVSTSISSELRHGGDTGGTAWHQ